VREQPSGLARALVWLIRIYQRFSALTPAVCRFQPTCSEYTATAIARHGALKGLRLGVRRLLRCHPFHPGGFDPVPPAGEAPAPSHGCPSSPGNA
jgi:putative membrane protein insertion efficiency factor